MFHLSFYTLTSSSCLQKPPLPQSPPPDVELEQQKLIINNQLESSHDIFLVSLLFRLCPLLLLLSSELKFGCLLIVSWLYGFLLLSFLPTPRGRRQGWGRLRHVTDSSNTHPPKPASTLNYFSHEHTLWNLLSSSAFMNCDDIQMTFQFWQETEEPEPKHHPRHKKCFLSQFCLLVGETHTLSPLFRHKLKKKRSSAPPKNNSGWGNTSDFTLTVLD